MNLISLGVKDFAASLHFYEHILGFTRLSYNDSEPHDASVAFFEMNGTWLAICSIEQHDKNLGVESRQVHNPAGMIISHNVKSTFEAERVMADLKQKGAKIISETSDTPWGGFGGHFSDPDGFVWAVIYNPFFWPGPDE